jgi:Autophagy receptor ATG43
MELEEQSHHGSYEYHASDSEAIESPRPRLTRRPLPPIPDLRFEQSYLKQLEAAKGSVFWIIVITIREQILFPGVQGCVWALATMGIRTLRLRQAESGRQWGTWIQDFFRRLVRTDTTMMGSNTRK